MICMDGTVNVPVAQVDSLIELLRRIKRKRNLRNRELSEIDHMIADLIDVKNSSKEGDIQNWIAILPSMLRLLAELVPAVKELFDKLR